MKRRILDTAERLLYLRRCSIKEVPKYTKMLMDPNLEDREWFNRLRQEAEDNIDHFGNQIIEMVVDYGLKVDLKKDRVKYRDPILNEKLEIEW